jgi:hypothetical protein
MPRRRKYHQDDVVVFFVSGDEIVDVDFIKFDEVSPGAWKVSKEGAEFTITAPIDRVVWETPVGCFETQINLWKYDRLIINPNQKGGLPLRPCTNPPKRFSESYNCKEESRI